MTAPASERPVAIQNKGQSNANQKEKPVSASAVKPAQKYRPGTR
jgi:hypothetical protein